MAKVRFLMGMLVGCSLLASVGCKSDRVADTGPAAKPNSEVAAFAQEAVAAFKAKDGKRLAQLVHPVKGVRFSPYAYVEVAQDQVLSRAEIERLWQDEQRYRWGLEDATGEPIELTPSQYCERYVMDRDFEHPTSIGIDADRARGNTVSNAAEVYPETKQVEFYVEPAPGKGDPSFDWAALRLVLERSGERWYLVGVIHDRWTT